MLALLLVCAVIYLRLVHGGGKPYPDVSTNPILGAEYITSPIQLPYPPGMVASSTNGRIFYTYHMLHKPERFSDATVFEWVNGKGVPFPSLAMQKEFHGAMGITTDNFGRLWVIKPGALEGKQTRLLAIDMQSGALVIDHLFAQGEAGFAQDMRVSADGSTVFLADTGLFKFTKASLIVFNVATQTSRTVLKGHRALSPQDWIIRKSNDQDYKLAFGLLTFAVGVDGIALSHDDQWLYFAAMSHDSLYRIPTSALRDKRLHDEQLALAIEFIGHKPMSDGIELLADNTVVITDVENGGLALLSPAGKLTTLTSTTGINWADSVAIANDGAIWFTDSRLTDLIDQFAAPADKRQMRERGPYSIYRLMPAGVTQANSKLISKQ